MPNLKDIRRRIKSVKNTQKITQAMRMVAAAKVRRAEASMRAAKPFAEALRHSFAELQLALKHLDPEQLRNSSFAGFLEQRSVQSVALLVCSSDRGLCGAYNANLLRYADELIRYYQTHGITPKVYLVGNKAIQYFKKAHPSVEVLGRLAHITAQPSIHHARLIIDILLTLFQQKQIDRIELVSTRFLSMLSFKPEKTVVYPLDEKELRTLAVQDNGASAADSGSKKIAKEASLEREWEFEPGPQAILDQLMPMYLSQSLYARLLEAAASELAARMTAMANATDNAKGMIQRLTLVYNKARQAAITQEIMEIVGGANALAEA